MRGDRWEEALLLKPARASPEDSPRVRDSLRPGGTGGPAVSFEAADEYEFWGKTRYAPVATIRVHPPVTRVYAARGAPLPHVVDVPAPVLVGTEEQARRRVELRALRDELRKRGKGA